MAHSPLASTAGSTWAIWLARLSAVTRIKVAGIITKR